MKKPSDRSALRNDQESRCRSVSLDLPEDSYKSPCIFSERQESPGRIQQESPLKTGTFFEDPSSVPFLARYS